MLTKGSYPFSVIVGDGLGSSYSSEKVVGELLPSKTFGDGGIKIYANAATGNLTVVDHLIEAVEKNGTTHLGFVYNNQAKGSAWRLAVKSLANLTYPPGNTVTLIEEDGHETLYTYDSTKKAYLAATCGDGQQQLIYDEVNQGWNWFDPKTGAKEQYAKLGFLNTYTDALGNTSSYYYDSINGQAQLSYIIGPSGSKYQIQRDSNTISFYLIETSGTKTLLQTCVFDGNGRLVKTQIGTNKEYEITYYYDVNPNNLCGITQTDGTQCSLTIQNNKVSKLIPGSKGSGYTFSYNQNSTTITAPEQNQQNTINFDSNNRVTQLIRQQGNSSLPNQNTETTAFQYNGGDYSLSNITRPDGSQEKYQYDNLNMRMHHIGATGQEEHYQYDQNTGELLVKTKYLKDFNGNLVRYVPTRYVYDTSSGRRLLRFEISSTGRVTEYRYDSGVDLRSKRIYLNNKYDVSKLPIDQVPTLSQMTDWLNTQDPKQVALQEYSRDARGQTTAICDFVNVDDNGKGKYDKEAADLDCNWTLFGKWASKAVRQEGDDDVRNDVYLRTGRDYDCLNRLVSQVDAGDQPSLKRETKFQYHDQNQQVVVTYPNGKTETKTFNTQGIMTNDSAQVTVEGSVQTRVNKYDSDLLGRKIRITDPDGLVHYNFYTLQNKLAYEVSTLGQITGYIYDANNRYEEKIRYADTIPFNDLDPSPSALPSVDTLEKLINEGFIENDPNNRYSYKFYDNSNRLVYEVDEENYLAQYLYDNLDRKIGEVKYATAITQDQLNQLKQAKDIGINPNVIKDRWVQYFYDDDNQLIAEQDGAGYVTEYKKDVGGRTIEKIKYTTPTDHKATLDQVRPIPCDKDIHNYYYWNNRSQCIAEIDGENYMTRYSYLADGKKQQELRYANKVTADPSQTRDLSKLQPNPSNNDHKTLIKYDALGREIKRDLPNGSSVATGYSNMDDVELSKTSDLLGQSEARQKSYAHDGWQQVIKEEKWNNAFWLPKYDVNGLKLSVTDPNGHTIKFYYDNAKRLCYVVDPRGALIEKQYNIFNDSTLSRFYAKLIDKDNLAKLSGGFLTTFSQGLFDSLKDDNKDEITQKVSNKRGLIEQTIDPEGYVTKIGYNAFAECQQEQLPVSAKSPSLTISYEYEQRGFKTKTVKTTQNLSLQNSFEYKNPLGKCTRHVDECAAIHDNEYDKNGNVSKTVDSIEGDVKKICLYTSDAFNRVAKETDSLQRVTDHSYVDSERSHAITKYDDNNQVLSKTLKKNAFDETCKITDELQGTTSIGYSPDGQVASLTDQLQRATADTFDLCGLHKTHKDAKGIETDFVYNEADQLQQKVVDASDLKLTTTYSRNAFGNPEAEINPRNVVSAKEFDRRNLMLKQTKDANNGGLKVTTQINYDAQKNVVGTIRGDQTVINQREEKINRDELGRISGKVIDPQGLNITTEKHLDKKGKVIAKKNAKGDILRYFYDSADHKRFKVDPMGDVTEWKYNTEGQEILCRHYAKSVDATTLTDQTSLEDVKALVASFDSKSDKLSYKFYNKLGKVRFIVNGLGVITEKIYDKASHEIAIKRYAKAVDPLALPNLTTDQLAQLVRPAPGVDRNTFKVLDSCGQEVFVFDAEGCVTEKVYDNLGQVITEIKYAQPVANPEAIYQLPLDQIRKNITPDQLNDRKIYWVFDAERNPKFIVHPEGGVTKYVHDENGNLRKSILFANIIANIPASYSDLVKLLEGLKENPSIDQITQYDYDNCDREVTITDSLGNKDSYKYDALNQKYLHVDRLNNSWQSIYDRAGRLTQEISPSVPTVLVESDNKAGKLLTKVTSETQLVKKIDYDNENNQQQVTFGFGSNDPRIASFSYDKCKHIKTMTNAGVLIDDPSKPASFNNRPEKAKDLVREQVLDAKGNVIVEINEAGAPKFSVRDSEGQVIYEVDAQGGLVQYDRNAFGEIENTTKYATPLAIDLNQYLRIGLTKEIIDANKKASSDDRIQTITYNRKGKYVNVQKGPVFYYLPNGLSPKFGYASTQLRVSYNAFDEEVYRGILTDPTSQVFAESITWRDRNGRVVAEADSLNYVKRYVVDTFGNRVMSVERAKPLAIKPNVKTMLAEVDKATPSDAKDRVTAFQYDLLNQEAKKIRKNIIVQQLKVNSYFPIFIDLPAQDLVEERIYGATQKLIAIKRYSEFGVSIECKYYNNCGGLIGETSIARTQADGSVLIPFTAYGLNVHGQQIKITRFKNGVSNPNPNVLPNPVPHAEDQTTLKWLDKRGLTLATADPEGHYFGFTYTETTKEARKWYYLTNPVFTQSKSKILITATHIDEQRVIRDKMENAVEVDVLRDNVVAQRTVFKYNVFSEQIGRGPGDGTYPEVTMRDPLGRTWLSNQGGFYCITTYGIDPYGDTAKMRSAVLNMVGFVYGSLESFLKQYTDVAVLERQESQRDLKGRKVVITQPAYPHHISTNKLANQGITCDVMLSVLNVHGQLHCNMQKTLAQQPLRIKINYCDQAGKKFTHEKLIDPTTNKGHYLDNTGRTMVCNTEFLASPNVIENISLEIFLDNQWLPLFFDKKPIFSSVQKESREGVISDYIFESGTFLLITNVDGLKIDEVFSYKEYGNGKKWNSLDTKISDLKVGTIVVDISKIKPGRYLCKVGKFANASFEINTNGDVCHVTDTIVQPTTTIDYDVWDNQVRQVTGQDQVITEYNSDNHVVKETLPPVAVTREDASTTTVSPVTVYGYNGRGYLIGVQDANGHIKGQIVDEAGQVAKFISGDGTVEQTNYFDIFGRRWKYLDSRNKVWQDVYNRIGNITQHISPISARTMTYYYNELGDRTATVDGPGHTTLYSWNVCQYIEKTYSPVGEVTTIVRDRNLQLVSETTRNGTISDELDFWGNKKSSRDLGNAYLSYARNYKGDVVQQTSQGGSHGSYLPFDPSTMGYSYTPVANPGQNIVYTFLAGKVVKIQDISRSITEDYDYDFKGRPVSKVVRWGSYVIQNIQVTYDALNRATLVSDINATINTAHDAIGNPMMMKGVVSGNNGYKTSQWNKYDWADRIEVDGGDFFNNRIEITITQGKEISYSNGYRSQEKYYVLKILGYATKQITYDDEGLLIKSVAQGKGLFTYNCTRINGIDNSRRIYAWQNDLSINNWGTSILKEITTYNQDDWVLSTYQSSTDNQGVGTTASTSFDTFGADGQSSHQITKYTASKNDRGVWDELNTSFVYFMNREVCSLGGYRHSQDGTSSLAIVRKYFDCNGAPQALIGVQVAVENNMTYDTYSISDTNGKTISCFQIVHTYDGNGNLQRNDFYFTKPIYNLKGQVVGRYLLNWPADAYNTGSISLSRVQSVGDCAAVPPKYKVTAGDTFETIAEKFCLDNCGSDIAEANGFSANTNPPPGYTLTIPRIASSVNYYHASEPYQKFMSLMWDNISPHLVAAKPKQEHHHNFFKMLMEIIATTIVSLAIPQLGATLWASLIKTFGSVVEGFIQGAVTGALVDATKQGLAIGFHDQQGFNFGELGKSALEFAASGGILGGAAPSQSVVTNLMRGAVMGAVCQGIELMCGGKFDIKAVLEQAVAYAAAMKVADLEGGFKAANMEQVGKLIGSGAKTVTETALSCMLYGTKMDVTQFAACYVNNLANDEGQAVQEKMKQDSSPQKKAYQNSQQQSAKQQQFYGDSKEYQKAMADVSKKQTVTKQSNQQKDVADVTSDGVKVTRQQLDAINADMYKKTSKLPQSVAHRLSDLEIHKMGINPAEFNDDKTGMHAGLYRLANGGYVLAYEGTNDSAGWKTNFAQAFNREVPAYTEAARVATDVAYRTHNNVVYTGHSLGGGEASVAALVTKDHAYTFNAEGVNQTMISKLDLHVNEANRYITAYNKPFDPLTTAQKYLPIPEALGKQVTIPLTNRDVVKVSSSLASGVVGVGIIGSTMEAEHYLHSMDSFMSSDHTKDFIL